jgi:transcriptional regulator with XRE-family HTH domain
MATETLRKFAEELKSARESKQITLQQIANKTKIDIKFLQAIENANYELLPEIYIKAFIKEYAQQVDLDLKETIVKFDYAKKGRSEQPEQIESIPVSQSEPPRTEQTNPEPDSTEASKPTIEATRNDLKKNYTANYIYSGVIGILVLALCYFIFFNNSSPNIIADGPAEELTNTGGARFEVADQNTNNAQLMEQSQISDSKPDSLRIRLLMSAKVWIKVTADGKIVHQQMVQPDSKLRYAAAKNCW